MFRAIICSPSGGQIVYIQHLVSSLSIGERGGRALHSTQPVYCVLHGHHVTIQKCVYIQFDLLRMSILLLETCREM
jgi:hypothetical protein